MANREDVLRTMSLEEALRIGEGHGLGFMSRGEIIAAAVLAKEVRRLRSLLTAIRNAGYSDEACDEDENGT